MIYTLLNIYLSIILSHLYKQLDCIFKISNHVGLLSDRGKNGLYGAVRKINLYGSNYLGDYFFR